MVSVFATQATSERSFRPRRLPILASVRLRVGEPNLGGQMRAQDPVLCDEIFALEKQGWFTRPVTYASNRAQLLFCIANQHGTDDGPSMPGEYFGPRGTNFR